LITHNTNNTKGLRIFHWRKITQNQVGHSEPLQYKQGKIGKLEIAQIEKATSLATGGFPILAERTGDSAKTVKTQCSCGFQADAHSKATPKEWLTPMGK
jgi:hypothetical protein